MLKPSLYHFPAFASLLLSPTITSDWVLRRTTMAFLHSPSVSKISDLTAWDTKLFPNSPPDLFEIIPFASDLHSFAPVQYLLSGHDWHSETGRNRAQSDRNSFQALLLMQNLSINWDVGQSPRIYELLFIICISIVIDLKPKRWRLEMSNFSKSTATSTSGLSRLVLWWLSSLGSTFHGLLITSFDTFISTVLLRVPLLLPIKSDSGTPHRFHT